MATFTNVATLSYNGTVVNSNVTTGEIQQTLSATKYALSETYGPDSDITYIVNIVNNGSTAFTNLTLTDNLGAYAYETNTVYPLSYTGDIRYFINGVLQTAPTVTAGPPLVITGINVPANSEAQIVYKARTTAYAPLDIESAITNNITVTGGGIAEPVTATETVNAVVGAILDIEKALSPIVVSENGQITYTFTITNKGNTAITQADNVVLRDVFNPILKGITVSYNGAALDDTKYTYDETTGVFETAQGAITVPAATFTTNTDGTIAVTPGKTTVTVTGTLG